MTAVLLGAASSYGAPFVFLAPSFPEGAHLGEPATITAEVSFAGAEYFGSSEPLTEATLQLPAGTVLNDEGFPTCSQATLEQVGPIACPAGSAAGQPGSFSGFLSLGGERIEEEGRVESFFAPGGGMTFFLTAHAPVALEVLVPAQYQPPASEFGPGLMFQLPLIQSVPGAPYLSLKRLTISLGAFRKEAGSELASVTTPAACQEGLLRWRILSTFEDGTGMHRTSVATEAKTACTVRPASVGGRGEEEARQKAEREATERIAEEAAKKRSEEEARTIAALEQTLTPRGRAARFRSLLKLGTYSFAFTAPSPGTLALAWYELSGGAHITSTRRPVLVASGHASIAIAGTAKVAVRLTADGRRLLRHARRPKLIARSVFTALGATALSAEGMFVLNR